MTLDSDTNGHFLNFEPGEQVIHFHLDELPLHPTYYHCSASLGGSGFSTISSIRWPSGKSAPATPTSGATAAQAAAGSNRVAVVPLPATA